MLKKWHTRALYGVYAMMASSAPRSWNAHGFVACAAGFVPALIAHVLGLKPTIDYIVLGWLLAYFFYRVREWKDEAKYRKHGVWLRRKKDGVTPEIDGKGDIIVPRWLAIAGILIWIFNHRGWVQ